MKFLPHFDAKLEYLVHRLELQPHGAKAPGRSADNSSTTDQGNLRDLAAFRASKSAGPGRLAKGSR